MTPECQRVDERLLDFVYGELAAQARAEVSAHLAGCERCSKEIESLQGTRSALRALPEEDPPADLTARLMHEAARPRTVGARLRALLGAFTLHPGWSLGAATAVVLLLSMVVFREEERPVPVVHEQVVQPEEKPALANEQEPAAPASAPVAAKPPQAPAAAAPRRQFVQAPPAPSPRKERARNEVARKPVPNAAPSPGKKKALSEHGDDLDALLSEASSGRGAGSGAAMAEPAEAAEPLARSDTAASSAADEIRREGDRRRAKGDCPGAIRSYEQLLSQYPDYPERNTVQRAIVNCRAKTAPAAAPPPAATDKP